MKNYRVLVLAEAANPDWTSVPLLGWFHTAALKKVCSVHLATQIRNRSAILNAGWKEGEDFSAIDSERIMRPLHKFASFLRGGDQVGWTISTALSSIGYLYFEYIVWRQFKKRLEEGEFDIVHRITPVSPTAPSLIAKKLKKIGIPFVVGPLNGGVPWPKQFRSAQHQEKEWLSYIRDFYKLLPGYAATRRDSSAIIVGSKATYEQMAESAKGKCVFLPENGVNEQRFSLKRSGAYSLPLKAAFVGRLVPYKGADMAIEAMHDLVKAGALEYHIYGDGPERARLQEMIDQYGLRDKVVLHGFVKNENLQNELSKCDLLVFPSIREFGGGAVLEAMALGVVPVVVDYGGPADLVSGAEGYLIPLGEREQIVASLRATLSEICSSPEVLSHKSALCVEKIIDSLTWDAKVRQVINIYDWISAGGEKPAALDPAA